MADLDLFAKRIDKISFGVTKNAGKLMQKTALIIDQALVLSTPVDTGRARSNWLVEINKPIEVAIEAHTTGDEGSTTYENTQASINRAKNKIVKFKGGQDHAIYISNNLFYIDDLNNGSSAQAPANFIEFAVNQGKQAANKSKIID